MKIDTPPYACDVCKKPRVKDTNHWYVLLLLRDDGADGLGVYRWNDVEAALPGTAHVCGQDHADVLIARWMDHGTFTERANVSDEIPRISRDSWMEENSRKLKGTVLR